MPAAAQVSPPASPFLSPDHWSYRALRRLDHAGVLPRGADVARQSIPQEEIAAWLAWADSVRGTGYATLFRTEFGAPRADTLTVLERSVQVGYRWTKDELAPGVGYDSLNWAGALPRRDDTEYLYGFRFGVTHAPHLALGADLTGEWDDWLMQLNATAGPVGAWAGRRDIGYGTGVGGGLVLNAHRLTGGGVYLTRPLALPVLGPVRFEMHLSQIDNVLNLNAQQFAIEPWFWTARASFEPLTHLRVGINRGMMFGGEGNLPVTFSRVAKNLIGVYTDEDENSFANQVISVDLRVRVPGVPLAAYLDWGSDDAAGGWADVPGLLAGLEYVHVDSTFDVAVGAEHLQFSRSCCGNSIWYRNAWFRGGWADAEDVLGHPLGGHGREWRVFTNGSFGSGRVAAHAAVYARRRGAENLMVPVGQGKSTGVSAGADLWLHPRLRLLLDSDIEWGANDWTASRLQLSLRRRF